MAMRIRHRAIMCTGMKQWIARHDTAVFLVVTYAISWPLWLVSGALTRTPIRIPDLPWLVGRPES